MLPRTLSAAGAVAAVSLTVLAPTASAAPTSAKPSTDCRMFQSNPGRQPNDMARTCVDSFRWGQLETTAAWTWTTDPTAPPKPKLVAASTRPGWFGPTKLWLEEVSASGYPLGLPVIEGKRDGRAELSYSDRLKPETYWVACFTADRRTHCTKPNRVGGFS